MNITGNIWAKKITEEHPGSIKGQFSEMITYNEKRGKIKVQIKKSEMLFLLTATDTPQADGFCDAVNECDYPNLLDEIDYNDIEVEVLNG